MTFTVFLVVIVIAIFVAVAADIAVKEEGHRKSGIGPIGYAVYIALALILSAIMAYSKVLCVIVALAIGLFGLLNKEGKARATSWSLALALDFICLLFAIMHGWDARAKAGQFPKFQELGLLIIPLILFAAIMVKGIHLSKRIEKKQEKKDLAKAFVEAQEKAQQSLAS